MADEAEIFHPTKSSDSCNHRPCTAATKGNCGLQIFLPRWELVGFIVDGNNVRMNIWHLLVALAIIIRAKTWLAQALTINTASWATVLVAISKPTARTTGALWTCQQILVRDIQNALATY